MLDRRSGLVALALVVLATVRIAATYTVFNHTADEPAHVAPEVSRRLDGQGAEAGEHGLLDQLDPRRPAPVEGGSMHA